MRFYESKANRLLASSHVVAFAHCLALLNPMTAYAYEVIAIGVTSLRWMISLALRSEQNRMISDSFFPPLIV